jgi:hypothetical protein
MPRAIWKATALAAFILAAPCLFAEDRYVDISPDGVWRELAPTAIDRSREVAPRVLAYRPVEVDMDLFAAATQRAPMEFEAPLENSEAVITLPKPDGTWERFRIEEAPLLAPQVAAEFPHHRAWRGQGIDDPSATMTLVFNDLGVSAQVLSAGGHWYIDPLHRGEKEQYASYFRSQADPSRRPDYFCSLDEGSGTLPDLEPLFGGPRASNMLRYRLAVAAAAEYTTFHGGQSQAFSAIQTTVARVRGLYERDLSITFQLVSGTNIVFTNAASDPYSVPNAATMLGQNQTTIDSMIGNANYDIGHVVYAGAGGGIAGLGVVCSAGNKARGVTGTDFPVGDSFDVDYVAHEMGHQFRGNHTFNTSSPSCASQRYAATAVEPGSGTTIMAYAGICPPDNIQSTSDATFSYISLQEIRAFVTTGGGAVCDTPVGNTNNAPVVTAPPNKTIPPSTPFELTATASDPDGDTLTYSWEQSNASPTAASLTTADDGIIPMHRAFLPSSSPTRSFPRLQLVLANSTSSAERYFTAPSTNRRFTVTVRDNNASGGLFAQATTVLTIDTTKSPFSITSPNTNVSWPAGSTQTVLWNPESLTTPLAANVDITMSHDGGTTFPTTIITGTPNDGSHTFTVPNILGNQTRIKIKASDNYFYDINNSNFRIVAGADTTPPTPVFATTASNPTNASPIPYTVDFGENINGSTFTTADITLSGTASAGATVSTPSAISGTQVYSFNVTPPANANGTIQVNMAAGAVQDLAGNSSNAATPLSLTVDRLAPTAISFAPVTPSTGTLPVEFDIVFSENVTGLTPSAVLVSGTAPGTPSVTVTTTTPNTAFRIAVNGFTGEGTVTISFTPGAIEDTVGNDFVTTGVTATATYTGATSATRWEMYQ